MQLFRSAVQAPSQQQLQALWSMLAALQRHSSGGADDTAAWDALADWGLLPLAAGDTMMHCTL